MHRLNRELPETEVCSLSFFFLPLEFEELLVVYVEKEKTTPPRVSTICEVLSRRKTKLRVGERYKIAVKSREESRKKKIDGTFTDATVPSQSLTEIRYPRYRICCAICG